MLEPWPRVEAGPGDWWGGPGSGGRWGAPCKLEGVRRWVGWAGGAGKAGTGRVVVLGGGPRSKHGRGISRSHRAVWPEGWPGQGRAGRRFGEASVACGSWDKASLSPHTGQQPQEVSAKSVGRTDGLGGQEKDGCRGQVDGEGQWVPGGKGVWWVPGEGYRARWAGNLVWPGRAVSGSWGSEAWGGKGVAQAGRLPRSPSRGLLLDRGGVCA